jgi:hypothetical protein
LKYAHEAALIDLINKELVGTSITLEERPRGEHVVDLT